MTLSVRSAVIALGVLGSLGAAHAGTTGDGTWLTEDGRAKIRTEHCGSDGGHLCGYVVWLKSPTDDNGKPRLDIKNPDPAKRSRPSLGLELLNNLAAEDDKHFAGEIYNADDGKMYAVTIGFETADEVNVHGCWLKILCGSQTWTRTADVAVPGIAPAPAKLVATGAAKKHDAPK